MKLLLSLATFVLFGFVAVRAQSVSVEVMMDRQYFLPNESLVAKVRVTNYSGQTLILGKDPDWLTFSVEGKKEYVVAKLGNVPVVGEYNLDSSRTGTKAVDLAPYFDLSRPGHYTVIASVKIPQWGQTIQSQAKGFDIVRGGRLWEQEFGLPSNPADPPARPEIRRYSLVQTTQQNGLLLYFRLSDATDTKVFRIFPIGAMVSFSRPEPQIDKFSNLHVLNQFSARSFIYSVVNPDGLLIVRETYDYSDSKPRLRAVEDGRINVAGGVRRIKSDDIPPAIAPNSTANAGTSLP